MQAKRLRVQISFPIRTILLIFTLVSCGKDSSTRGSQVQQLSLSTKFQRCIDVSTCSGDCTSSLDSCRSNCWLDPMYRNKPSLQARCMSGCDQSFDSCISDACLIACTDITKNEQDLSLCQFACIEK